MTERFPFGPSTRPAPPVLAFKDSWIGPHHQGAASPRLEHTLGRSEGWLFKRERGELRPGGSRLHKRAILQRPATRTWARTRPVRLKKSSALPTPAHPPVRSTLGDDVLPGLPLAFLGGFVGQVRVHVHTSQGAEDSTGKGIRQIGAILHAKRSVSDER